MTDTIGNLLTSVRNAELASRPVTTAPYAKMSVGVLDILKANNYIAGYTIREEGKKSFIDIEISQPVIRHNYKRVSKPGRRLYTSADKIPTVLRGLGLVIVSTPKGLMVGKDARKQKLGGELICEVY